MCSWCKICNLYAILCCFSFYAINSILFGKIHRKITSKFNFNSCICCLYIYCCCSYACCYRNIGVFNVKIYNSFVSIVGYAGNCFAHHGYIMCRTYRTAMYSCCKARAPCQMTAFPDVLQMTESICGSVCCIDHSSVNAVSCCVNNTSQCLFIQIQFIISIFGICCKC